TPFIQHAHGRPVILQPLSRCMAIEQALQDGLSPMMRTPHHAPHPPTPPLPYPRVLHRVSNVHRTRKLHLRREPNPQVRPTADPRIPSSRPRYFKHLLKSTKHLLESMIPLFILCGPVFSSSSISFRQEPTASKVLFLSSPHKQAVHASNDRLQVAVSPGWGFESCNVLLTSHRHWRRVCIISNSLLPWKVRSNRGVCLPI
ncbi:hypothetical protein C8J57DRAFT_1320255, partial [Mycena rebaudengoi]